jgi:hypothetical protein
LTFSGKLFIGHKANNGKKESKRNTWWSALGKQKTPTFTGVFAPQVGLEPTTYGLTVRRSNQLSY